MFFNKPKFVMVCSIVILILLSGMTGAPPPRSKSEATPQISISTPSYPVGMDSMDSRQIPYIFKSSGNFSGVITSRVFQFHTQYDEPLSDLLGPYQTRIDLNSLQTSEWNDPVYLPESVVEEARALEEYAIVLKTTFFGVTSSGDDFSADASLLLLLPPASFSKQSPANQAVNQPFNLALQWNSSVGAIDYEYCFDTINNNSCDAGWIGTYGVQAKLRDLPASTTFYWQVRANNTGGSTYANNGNWWSFRTCSQSLITVTNTNDSGTGSLRRAIADTCAGGTVRFAASLSGKTITLASTLVLNKNLTIDGSGLASRITLNGNHQRRILHTKPQAQVTINNLRFSNALAVSGGAIYNTGNLILRKTLFSDNDASNGGAIYNEGNLNIIDSVFSGNSATSQGGGIFNSANASLLITDSSFLQNTASDGGAIITTIGSETVIARSLFSKNTANSTGGAILVFPGTVSVTNSTLAANTASSGGAIDNEGGTLTVVNSTFSANHATSGGGIANGGVLHLSNTILANSIAPSDCLNNGSVGTNINNLVETSQCGIPLISSDPKLGPLAANGGLTRTMALLPGSPAIDTGNDASCPATDQRGIGRVQGSHCDIGAYEAPAVTQLKSAGAQDGWVLETSENSNQGGTLNPTVATFLLGDSAGKRQYRSILHFNTSSLPDDAIITRVVLKIRKQNVTGTDPFTTHGKIAIDIRKGAFSNLGALQAADFQAPASKAAIGLIPNTPQPGGWYSARLNAAAYPFINRMGITQFRLRFQTDDDNDAVADFIRFYSGNSSAVNQPILVIEYYVP